MAYGDQTFWNSGPMGSNPPPSGGGIAPGDAHNANHGWGNWNWSGGNGQGWHPAGGFGLLPRYGAQAGVNYFPSATTGGVSRGEGVPGSTGGRDTPDDLSQPVHAWGGPAPVGQHPGGHPGDQPVSQWGWHPGVGAPPWLSHFQTYLSNLPAGQTPPWLQNILGRIQAYGGQ